MSRSSTTRMVREMPYFDVPCCARPMVDHLLGDRDADLAGDGRDEAVHLAVEPQRLDDLGAERLQRAAVVVQAGRRSPREISRLASIDGSRRVEERVLAVLAASRRRCRAPRRASATSAGMSRGSFCRSPSEVTMMRAARVGEAGREGRRLAEVAAEADHAQPRIGGVQLAPGVESCRRVLPSSTATIS